MLLIILYSDDVSCTTKVTDLITEHPTQNSPLKWPTMVFSHTLR